MANDDTYTHGHTESVLRSHSWRTVENSAGYLIDDLKPGVSVLDVGCGPGTITADIADRVAPGLVIGMDQSADVIAGASTNFGDDTLHFVTGDCYDLEFVDNRFDIVHAHQVLQHLSDPVAALTEMKRVAQPGGIVAVRDADYAGMFWSPAVPELDRWMDIYRQVARHNSAEPDAGRWLVKWAHAAGLCDIEASAHTWVFTTAEEKAWWGGLWHDRVADSPLTDQAVEYGIASRSEMVEVAGGFTRWADDPDAWFAVPNSELRCRV